MVRISLPDASPGWGFPALPLAEGSSPTLGARLNRLRRKDLSRR
jgi:hypothetical protein